MTQSLIKSLTHSRYAVPVVLSILFSFWLGDSAVFGHTEFDNSAWTIGVLIVAVTALFLVRTPISTHEISVPRRFFTPSAALFISTVALNFWVILAHNTIYWFDDSFYYLEIAHNIVVYGESTFDGLSTTNGYHPLWMGILLILSTVANKLAPTDPTLPIRLVQLTQLLLLAGVTVLFYFHLVRVQNTMPAVLFALGYLAVPYTRENTLSGMETTLLLLILLTSNYMLTSNVRSKSANILFVATFALLILTRIETGLLWAAFCVLYLLMTNIKCRSRQDCILMGGIGVGSGSALLLSVGMNYMLVGKATSFAGEIKREWALEQFSSWQGFTLWRQIHSLLQSAVAQTVIEYPSYLAVRSLRAMGFDVGSPLVITIWTVTILVVIVGLMGLLIWNWAQIRTLLVATGFSPLILFALALSGVYKILLFSNTSTVLGGHDFQGAWYHQPFNTAIYLCSALCLFAVLNRFRSKWLNVVTVLVLPIGLVGTQTAAIYSETNRSLFGNQSFHAVSHAIADGEPITCYWHPNGGRDGYAFSFADTTVINGDGLVNSPEYFTTYRKQDRIADYLRLHQCPYFVAPYFDPTATDVVHSRQDAVLIQRSFGSSALWKLVDDDTEGSQDADIPTRS